MIKNFSKVIGGLIIISILTLSFIQKPELTGDGSEYYLMLESLYNHQTPELRSEDINSFKEKEELYGFKVYQFDKDNAYSGYFESNGNFYSYHFFFYSLISLPVKIVLENLNLDVLKVFQITNALLLSIVVFVILRIKDFSELKKTILILFTIFNPILWFIFWSHPEVFSYSFLTLSLIYLLDKKLNLAIILSILASFQNFPLIIIPFLIFIYKLYLILKVNNFKILNLTLSNLRDIVFTFLLSLISFIPLIFYLINFNTISLISSSGGTNTSLISLQRIFELVFDLNIGLLPYSPIFLMLGLILFIYLFIKLKFLRIPLILSLISLIFILGLSSSTTNWNHGTTGPSRYVLWSIIPFLFFILLLFFKYFEVNRKLIILSGFNIVINLIILLSVFLPNVSFGALNHSYLSKFVLDNYPSLYNPTAEIFAERTLGKENIDIENEVIIYKDCKKVLNKGEYINSCVQF